MTRMKARLYSFTFLRDMAHLWQEFRDGYILRDVIVSLSGVLHEYAFGMCVVPVVNAIHAAALFLGQMQACTVIMVVDIEVLGPFAVSDIGVEHQLGIDYGICLLVSYQSQGVTVHTEQEVGEDLHGFILLRFLAHRSMRWRGAWLR